MGGVRNHTGNDPPETVSPCRGLDLILHGWWNGSSSDQLVGLLYEHCSILLNINVTYCNRSQQIQMFSSILIYVLLQLYLSFSIHCEFHVRHFLAPPLPPPTMTYGVGDYADTSRGKEPELNSSDKLPGKVEAEDVHEVVDPAGPSHRVQATPLVHHHRLGHACMSNTL
jgi:hypothetical protein